MLMPARTPYPPLRPAAAPPARPVAPDLLAVLPALGEQELRALIQAAELAQRWHSSPDLLAVLGRGRAALELELEERLDR